MAGDGHKPAAAGPEGAAPIGAGAAIPEGSPPVTERLSFRIHQLNAMFARVCNPMFRQYKVDLISSRILVLVLELGTVRAGELVDLMILPQSTISHQLQRLERLGYVERSRRGEDQRVVTVSLTPTGRLVADACERLSLEVYRVLVQDVEAASLDHMNAEFSGMLRRLSAIGERGVQTERK